MFGEMFKDARSFVKDNRNLLYTVAIIILLDHFIFDGAFRGKLHDLVGKALGKVEKKLEVEQ